MFAVPEAGWFTVALLIGFIAAACSTRTLNDGDTFWHLRTGEGILDHRAVPFTDPFSFTFGGKAWHVHEWLGEVYLALAWRAAGWSGVIAATALAAGTALGLINVWLRRHVSGPVAILALVLAFAGISPGMLARPQLLAVPMLAGWTLILLHARAAGRAPKPQWLLLMLAWANLHGTSVFGAALVGPFALEALLAARGSAARWQVVREWALFGIGALAALLATPRGLDGVLFLIGLTQMKTLQLIGEWRPTSLTQLSPALLLAGAGAASLLLRRVAVPPVRLALLILLVAMTWQHQRHQVLLAVVGTMVWAEAFGRGVQAKPALWRAWLPTGALALLAGAMGLRLAIPAQPAESAVYPVSAFAHVPAALRGRPVLNGNHSGGFLISQGIKPFIDSRTDLYGDDFNLRDNWIEYGGPGQVAKALDEFRIEWTFLPSDSPAAHQIDAMAGWRRIHADQWVTIHARDAAVVSNAAATNEKGPG